MRKLKILLISYSTVLLLALGLNANASNKKVKPDVRVLIDISGSMKKNDPKNLRVPALQLVTNLLPSDAKAGVWAFGRYVNMMVPLSDVNTSWQNKATKTAKKINSAGLFTNIGGVLEKASYGWNKPNANEKRSVILLTDGMVDISKDATVNAKERERIINQVLPKLKKANVAIHTVALSQNADHELLKLLSDQTDGWYQAVESADKLQRVFLKIFEQSTSRDSLPLTDNQFNVDASIDEMTLLVFKKQPKEKVRLITPDNKVVDKGSQDGAVRWFSADGYELITIKKPQTGSWKIDANVDPDNRVMVVSKLSLGISDVPNNLLAGEAINYQLELLEDGKLITKPDFLKLISAQLEQSKQGQSSRLAMFFDSANNQFKQNFFTDNFEGVLNLTLEVKSPTFERTRNHAVNIYGSPLVSDVEISDNENQPHILKLSIREDIVNRDTLNISATINYPDGEKQYLVLDDLSRPIELKVLPQGGEYVIGLDIKGKTKLDRDFSVTPAPIKFTTSSLKTVEVIPPIKDDKEEVVEEEKEQVEPEVKEDKKEEKKEDDKAVVDKKKEPEKAKEEQPEEDNMAFWLYIGLGVNLLLVVLGFLGWKLIKKKNQSNTESMASELGIEESDED
ncbi:VWA domain-containing protein [Aliikangiella sp. IMCC44359]|uniref:VWA domain-containing protein n=1 Tax=Aliikangiella sp. IMCC44359 TaxID=3459125 RepID=UPI00403AA659